MELSCGETQHVSTTHRFASFRNVRRRDNTGRRHDKPAASTDVGILGTHSVSFPSNHHRHSRSTGLRPTRPSRCGVLARTTSRRGTRYTTWQRRARTRNRRTIARKRRPSFFSLCLSNSIGTSPSLIKAACVAVPRAYTSNDEAKRRAVCAKHGTAESSAVCTPTAIWPGAPLRQQRLATHTINDL